MLLSQGVSTINRWATNDRSGDCPKNLLTAVSYDNVRQNAQVENGHFEVS